MRTVRLGLAGTGFIGRIHWMCYRALPGIYAEVPARVTFETVYTSHAKKADRFEFSQALPYDLASSTCDKIDMLDVCTPNGEHHALVEAAVTAHKPVYCEKPVDLSGELTLALANRADLQPDCVGVPLPSSYGDRARSYEILRSMSRG